MVLEISDGEMGAERGAEREAYLVLLSGEVVCGLHYACNAGVDACPASVVGAVHRVRVSRAVRDVEVDLAVLARLLSRDGRSNRCGEVLGEVCDAYLSVLTLLGLGKSSV